MSAKPVILVSGCSGVDRLCPLGSMHTCNAVGRRVSDFDWWTVNRMPRWCPLRKGDVVLRRTP